jgi:hypothetical protein
LDLEFADYFGTENTFGARLLRMYLMMAVKLS